MSPIPCLSGALHVTRHFINFSDLFQPLTVLTKVDYSTGTVWEPCSGNNPGCYDHGCSGLLQRCPSHSKTEKQRLHLQVPQHWHHTRCLVSHPTFLKSLSWIAQRAGDSRRRLGRSSANWGQSEELKRCQRRQQVEGGVLSMSMYLHEDVHMTEWAYMCCECRHERGGNQSRESEPQRWPEEVILISESDVFSDTSMR